MPTFIKRVKSKARSLPGGRKQTSGGRPGSAADIAMRELQIPAVWLSALLFLLFGKSWIAQAAQSTPLTLVLFVWLFVAILWGAFGVVRHAEYLADKLGEPYGTLILTLSVTIIEVAFIITAVVNASESSPIVRDAVFAVVMIMINGTIGLCLLLGGLKHHEQEYNLPGASAFLGVAIPLAALTLVLPNFTVRSAGPTLSPPQAIVIAILILSLYGVFLAMQTRRYRSFFEDPKKAKKELLEEVPDPSHASPHSTGFHGAILVATLLPAVYLTEELGQIVERAVGALGAPSAIVGVIVAVLVLAPEMMGAVQATLRNQLQRAVNISLGSVLATIGLAVPVVLTIGLFADRSIILGVGPESLVLLGVTFLVSVLTFGGARTNMLQGATHLVLFIVFLTLIFHP
jgi:Ca2+:H+ antiporter